MKRDEHERSEPVRRQGWQADVSRYDRGPIAHASDYPDERYAEKQRRGAQTRDLTHVEPEVRPQSPHRGKGPKNFRRSDERIREDVCERLQDSDLDASDIEVSVVAGEVTLAGTVEDRAAERDAVELATRARGVTHCHNHLRIGAIGTGAPTRDDDDARAG